MSGSSYGKCFQITTWGESHGKAIGVVIDGCPAGLLLCEEDIQIYLDRRKPGTSKFSTTRKEDDVVEILSGVFNGQTTGTPISLLVPNKDHHSNDYSNIAEAYRPGHADFTFDSKYGFRDYRGGGRSSGRETIGRVAAGAIASKILKEFGIEVHAYGKEIGGLPLKDGNLTAEIIKLLEQKKSQGDSVGGIIECTISGMIPGIGEPVFEKLDANLSKAIMSIGAVKAFELGDGTAVAKSFGSENNDSLRMENTKIKKTSNHSGGILGGISDGSEIVFRAFVKPTPSIYKEQKTVNKQGEDINLVINGRHDPVIIPRAVVVVESMAALTVLDMLFVSIPSKMENLLKFFK